MQLVYPYTLIALLTLSACNGEKNTSDSASDSTTTGSASASETSATTAGPTSDPTAPTDATSDPTPGSASFPTTDSTTTDEPNPTSATTPTTDGTTTGSTTDDVPETGVVDGTQTVIEDACAPDDGPALEFKFAVAGDGCSADWPDDAPIIRIVLFKGGPLAPGSYKLDGGNGFASFDDGNGELVAQTGTIDLIDWNGGFPVGAIDITFSPDVHLTEQFAGTFCDTNPPCG